MLRMYARSIKLRQTASRVMRQTGLSERRRNAITVTAVQQHRSDEVLTRGIMFGRRNVSMRAMLAPAAWNLKGSQLSSPSPFLDIG